MVSTRKSNKRPASPAADDPPPKKQQPKKAKGKKAKAEAIKEEATDDAGSDQQQHDESDAAEQKKETKPAPQFKEAQIAKAGTSNIPLDEGCPTSYRVYVSPDDGVIYDAALNQTNASGNNNKFYRIQVSSTSGVLNHCHEGSKCLRLLKQD